MAYSKTEFGRKAVQAREVRLSPCQRAVFIMVDGKRPTADLVHSAESMGGSAADVQALISLGLIEEIVAHSLVRELEASLSAGPESLSGVSDDSVLDSVHGESVLGELEEVSGFTVEEQFAQARRIAVGLLEPHGLRARGLQRSVEACRNMRALQDLSPMVEAFLVPADKALLRDALGI